MPSGEGRMAFRVLILQRLQARSWFASTRLQADPISWLAIISSARTIAE
jgi:hypothetical protein